MSMIPRGRRAAFVDQPAPWDDETQDKLEKERDEAEKKLRTQLKEVDGRYYWEPGRTVSYNMTLTGRPLAMKYRLGGMFGVMYRDGVLTINPQWLSADDSLPSYAWAEVVDKMIHHVKQSEKISDMAEKTLDGVESKLGIKIESKVRQDIVKWCEKAAERRLSVRAYPGPKGKEFVIAQAAPVVASRISSIAEKVADFADSGPTKWGFDLMGFDSASAFQRVLSSAGISSSKEPARGHIGEFIWKGPGITIVTGNNPITGEYMVEGRRQPEQGFASYVGIEGREWRRCC